MDVRPLRIAELVATSPQETLVQGRKGAENPHMREQTCGRAARAVTLAVVR